MQYDAADALINTVRYPIHNPESDAARRCIADLKLAFERTGVCALPEFIHPNILPALVDEARAVAPKAFTSESEHSPWLSEHIDGQPIPFEHDRRERTVVGSVAADELSRQSLLRRVYDWPELTSFLAQVVGKPLLYQLDDPLGSCSINVFDEQGIHGWHFDESDFSITLMLQTPAAGGVFEYVPPEHAPRHCAKTVASVLDGDHSNVRALDFEPGTLLVFAGRHTLHRVTQVHGEHSRLVPVLCFADRPGVQNSAAVRLRFWGREA